MILLLWELGTRASAVQAHVTAAKQTNVDGILPCIAFTRLPISVILALETTKMIPVLPMSDNGRPKAGAEVL